MRIEVDIEAGVLQALLVRCAEERVDLSDVVTAWMKRANRQKRTVMPGLDQPRAKVVQLGGRQPEE
jgi:hypothetical protein